MASPAAAVWRELAGGPKLPRFKSPMGESMRQYIPVITLALLSALLLGVLLPSDNVVHAANPVWDDDITQRDVPENTPPGVNIEAPISATDADEDDLEFGNSLTYKLGGTDADKFDIDPSTGQLITKAPLDFENPRGGNQ